MKSLIATILLFCISLANATDAGISIYLLTGSIYVVEDSHYAKTNYVLYIGAASVTLVGAGWSPETAELLAQKIRTVTDKPVKEVVLPDHDPEYAGGIAYWKRIGANIVSTELTEQTLKSDWNKTGEFTRKYLVIDALVLPSGAQESSNWREAIQGAGGKAAQFDPGHCMMVYREQRDGRWLLSRDGPTLSHRGLTLRWSQRRPSLEFMDGF